MNAYIPFGSRDVCLEPEMTNSGKTFATAWDAIADTPEEAAVLKVRADS